MIRKILIGTLVITSGLLTACGTLKTKDRNNEAVAKIQKAALVAFTADLPARSGVELSLNSGKSTGAAGGSMIAKTSPVADKMMTSINHSFGEKMNWKMLPIERLASFPSYAHAYKETMDGWQNKMPPGAGINRFLVQGIMDAEGLRILGLAGRDQLMDGLGVDALVVSRVNVILNATTVMGIGSRYPQARVSFQIYKRGQEAPIWFETIEGKEMEESVGKTGLTLDEDKIAELGLASLQDGLSRLQ